MTIQPVHLHGYGHNFRGQDPGVLEWQYVLPIGPANGWSAVTSYVVGDAVSLGSDSYRCIAANTNQTPPDTAFWFDLSTDPLATYFQNSWTNVVMQQPLCFGLTLGLHVVMKGAVDNGSIPSVVFTLPTGYLPTQGPAPLLFPSGDGLTIFTGRVDTSGDVNLLGSLAI